MIAPIVRARLRPSETRRVHIIWDSVIMFIDLVYTRLN